jgi:hypothetical protein
LSTHLLPVGSVSSVPTVYRAINHPTDVTIQDTHVRIHNRIAYIGFRYSNNTFGLHQLNIYTGELSTITSFEYVRYAGGMLINDKYLYLSSPNYGQYLFEFDRLNGYAKTMYTMPTTPYGSAYGQIEWYDQENIIFSTEYGFKLFNINTKQWTTKAQTTSNSKYYFALGSNLILFTINSTSTKNILVYHKDTDTFSTLTVDTAGLKVVCYLDGKFYIAQPNKLYIYDEATETIETSVAVPWGTPKTINITNNTVFVTQDSSDRIIMYDLSNNTYTYTIIKWSVGAIGNDKVRRNDVFKGYFFFALYSLGYINFSKKSKYDLGYVFDQYTFLFNEESADQYTYNDEFVSFDESYLTLIDGTIVYDASYHPTNPSIKVIPCSKQDYGAIKQMQLVDGPAPTPPEPDPEPEEPIEEGENSGP